MRKIVHKSLSILGALENWHDYEWEGVLIDHDGRPLTAAEARRALLEELGQGRYMLLLGGPCEGFDAGRDGGCPGHPVPETEPEQVEELP